MIRKDVETELAQHREREKDSRLVAVYFLGLSALNGVIASNDVNHWAGGATAIAIGFSMAGIYKGLDSVSESKIVARLEGVLAQNDLLYPEAESAPADVLYDQKQQAPDSYS